MTFNNKNNEIGKDNEDMNWNIMGNDTIRRTYIIPITSKKKWWQFWKKDDTIKTKAQLASLMASYKEPITWNEETGEVNLNDRPLLPYRKDYWFPVKDEGLSL